MGTKKLTGRSNEHHNRGIAFQQSSAHHGIRFEKTTMATSMGRGIS